MEKYLLIFRLGKYDWNLNFNKQTLNHKTMDTEVTFQQLKACLEIF